MYDENFKLWAGINDEGLPETPWGIMATDLINNTDISQDRARETVILYCLKQGETRPLAQLFQLKISSSPALLHYVGVMMAPEEIPEKTLREHFPFGLKVCTIDEAKNKRPRSRTDEKHPFVQLRDNIIALRVKEINEGGGYDAAIAELAMLEGLDKETIRSATRKNPPASE
jgi:hypothetical protein